MIEQHLAPIRTVPTIQIVLLARLTAQPPPEDSKPDAELAGQLGPNCRVSKGVGRVEHITATTEPMRIRLSGEEISNQRFSRGDELVGENVPGTYLKPLGAHQLHDGGFSVRPHREIVLEENGLSVEQKGRAGLRGKLVEEIIESGNQAGKKDGLREVPLPVPVGVRDKMEGVPGHCRES